MSDVARYAAWVRIHGESAVLSVITGTTCPCMSYKNRVGYSAEYHTDNAEAEDCEKTGLIDPDKATTETSVYVIVGAAAALQRREDQDSWLKEIGEIQNTDLIMQGCFKQSDDSLVELAGYTEYNAFITYGGHDYNILNVFPIPNGVGEVAVLRRRS